MKKIKSQIVTNWCLTSRVKGSKNRALLHGNWINGFRFKTMIDTGSPVTIFAVDDIKKIMRRKDLQVRWMNEGEKYVDFNGKPLIRLAYVFCQLKFGGKFTKKAKILVAKEGTKSTVGSEWLSH